MSENHNLYHINSYFGDMKLRKRITTGSSRLNMPYCIYCLVI